MSLFSLREWVLSVSLMRAYQTLLPEIHKALVLLISLCILPLTFFRLFFGFFFLCSALEKIIIRHILSCRLFLYKATSLYACSSPNNYVTTEHFVMVHVCQHFCRALFPITSISICRITNKCVYNSCVCVAGVLHSTLYKCAVL